jgi:hypothetical protein
VCEQGTSCALPLHCRFGTRTTPIPIFLATRSGYLRRAFSANFLVLNGFDKMTSSSPLYSNSSHRTDAFIRELSQLLTSRCGLLFHGRE